VERALIPLQHDAVAAPDPNAHLRQPGSGRVLGVQLGREHLPQPARPAGLERHVAAGFELEAVQRRLEPEAAAVYRGSERKHRRLERLADAAELLERGLHIAHGSILSLIRARARALSAPAGHLTIGVWPSPGAGLRSACPTAAVAHPAAAVSGRRARSMSAVSEPAAASEEARSRLGLPIAIFASAQFVMVLDSSVMNVSISQIVADLDTTIQGVQLAITAYTLVMAALMLAGAKLGDIIGRDRTFALGLAVYGLGSLTTALSPNLTVLLIGWSLVEGLGAALVLPAIVSLIAATYGGGQRALAFGIVGGVAGAAVAAGPLIGGWVTTEFSWRYVFAGETLIVAVILILRRRFRSSPPAQRRRQLDLVGVALSALGLGLAVYGILKSSEWGWVEPRGALTVGGNEITPFGFSIVPFFTLAGLGCLAAFAIWEERREREGRDTLLDRSLLRIESLRAGLTTLMMQQLILLGTFFVLPVYLQVVLGLDASRPASGCSRCR
jgi:MFS family permease